MSIPETQLVSAKDNLNHIITLLGLSATSVADDDGNVIKITLTSDDAGRIIGRKGRTLSAIQLLLNSIMRRDFDDSNRVIIVFEGYEDRVKEKRRNDGRGTDDRRGGRNNNRSNDRGRNRDEDSNDENADSAQDDEPEISETVEYDAPEAIEEVEVVEEVIEEVEVIEEPEVEVAVVEVAEAAVVEVAEAAVVEVAEEAPAPRQQTSRAISQVEDALKEVRRWGEDVTLPPLSDDDCELVKTRLSEETEIEVVFEDKLENGKRRIKICCK